MAGERTPWKLDAPHRKGKRRLAVRSKSTFQTPHGELATSRAIDLIA